MGYSYGRVERVEVYANDVLVKRSGDGPGPDAASRGDVKMFSRQSRARLAFVAANTAVEFTQMATLTYPAVFPTDGRKVKRDLKCMLDWLRRRDATIEYLWFLEFQKRGAPHVHVLLSSSWPTSRADVGEWRKAVALEWYNVVGSGDSRHLRAGTRTEKLRSAQGGARYAVKYSMKMRQKSVPLEYRNVGRFWGHSRGVKPTPQAVYRCTEDDVRAVLDGWDYAPHESRPVYKVLYNTADRFRAWVGS